MSSQLALFDAETQETLYESREFLTKQLITYIGNKRGLLNFIGNGVKIVQTKLAKNKLKMFDVFSGSGIVARYFKQFADLLITNDLEKYSTIINQCYLANKSDLDIKILLFYYHEIINETNKRLKKGIYKNREIGIGQFGGKNEDALSRIK
ncbi:MAG: DNA adenine methylase [Spirochaetaceae bacterium]|jgi:adenine-specific DNA-methyltransferase|nr:DNA adenine methylase [Spirochaetaceae bacterium]